jgi:hypothetical protein
MPRNFKTAAALAVAAALGISASAHAAPVASVQLTSGDVVDGWRISFPTGIALDSDTAPGQGPNLVLEKFAAFDSLEGLDITFTQVSYSASPDITLADEKITNVSNTNWGGFQFLLNDTVLGMGTASKFTQSFNLNDPAENLFTSQTIHNQEIDFFGDVPNTYTSQLGFDADGGQVVIDTGASTMCMKKVIDFKEIPVAAAVPVPAAAWSGLSGLIGLGLLGSVKKLKKALA